MDQIPISIAAKIAEYTVQPVGQWLCYSFHYDNNIKNMKNQVKVLEAARDRVRHRVNEAENNVEEIELDVKLWLTEVDDILGKVNEVLDNEDNANKSCSQMACPNVKLRHKHSKKAKNIMQEIDELLKKGKFDKVSYRPTSQGLVSTTNMDWVTFESRMSTMKELMESLQDANINKIGVWGMAGVGKTTLVREVASHVKKENLFDVVAIATVKQRLDDTGKLRIQGEIADELGLQLDKKETLSGRASLLRTRLTEDSGKLQIQGEIADELDLKLDKKETLSGRASLLQTRLPKDETTLTKDETKKILVILDDIWENLDLSEIGIPCEGCKVVITSRERDLFSEMSVQKEFRLEVLPPKEAWRLFEKLVGDSLKDQLRLIAIEVSKECAGLPLALVTVANALKNKSESQWKNALQQLRQPSSTNCTKMQKVIYSAIQLSYNHLENSEVQSFFLFCGHQKDPYIDYTCLLKFCFGLKLFHGTNTLEEARNRMDTLLHDLKDSGLLLDFTSDYVLMHDLVIDAAVFIASLAENVLLMRGDGPITWPSEEKMKTYTEIFVHDMGIKQFPDALECPKLKFLFVHGKDCPLEISETFCEGMRELKVLDLTKLRISLLPSSINLLTNLQTLCLDSCVLGDIVAIGELKNLEILSLLCSKFTQLPKEIGLLTRLRLLDFSNCTKLEVIPSNVLSRLLQLEELYVCNSFTQWELGVNNERASLAELKHLSLLTTLEVNIPNANMLPKNLLFKKLKRYQIFIGDVWDQFGKSESSRALKLKLNSIFELEQGIKMLLSGIEDLCLDELKGVKSIISELDSKGFQQLKHLHVQNNSEMKYIIHSKGLGIADVVFPFLEIFSLKNMINLEEICHGQIPLTSFGNLSIVKVEHCEKLKFIFSSSIAKSLSQLQTLEIRKCSIMGAIVEKEEGRIEDRDMKLFPQLRRLLLDCLPKLVSFLSTQNSDIIDAGEVIPESEQVVFPNLETLELSCIHSEEILLHNQHRASSSFKLTDPRFQNLRDLKVEGSGNLKYLLSSSTATFMVQLKDLYIEDCKVMEEVLLTEDLEEEIIPKVLFPRLEQLVLKDLPVLKRFCVGSNIKFPSLKVMRIQKCPKLESFIFKPVSSGMALSKELKEVNSEEISQTAMQPLFNEEVAFPSLETLIIGRMENLKIIWHDQLAEDSFFKLRSLFVGYCENLVNIFESNMLIRFQSLRFLSVSCCGSLQEVFELQRLDVRESHVVTAISLKILVLHRLPKMKQVWNKDPQGIFSFQNLQEISVSECESLQSLFPASVATSLKQLKDLRIGNSGVEEIVAREDVVEATARHLFPKLTILYLQKLPKLKWFCRGVHTSEWPLLKDLEVSGCEQIEIFTSKISNFQETVEQSQLETFIQQPLFLVEEGTLFPNLEVLRWGGNYKMKEIQRDQLFEECLYKLKVLRVINFVAISDWITFLKKLHNLEKLFVKSNSWEEIFPYKELFDMENHATILARLRELELSELPMLTHLWKQDTQPSPIFHNLENLKVSICAKLKNLVPSSVSFQNLTILEICKCHGLINLVTSSTAKSLEQLKKMSVSKCERITEVITREGGEASEVITFTQLTYLKLDCLPKLSSFCSRSYSFEFPSLEEVIVRQCPEMKTFSHGALGTPKLERVQATQEDEWHWKANLNTTIHWLWESKYNTTTQ